MPKPKKRLRVALFSLAIIGLVLVTYRVVSLALTDAATAILPEVSPKAAFDFTDSIGTTTHFAYPSYNQNFLQKDQTKLVNDVNSYLTNSGIHHVREGVNKSSSWTVNSGLGLPDIKISLYDRMKKLSSSNIKFSLVASSWKVIPCSNLSTDTIAIATKAECVFGLPSTDQSYPTTQIVLPADTTNDIVSGVTSMRNSGISVESLEAYNEYHTYIPSSLRGKTWQKIYPSNWQQVISIHTKEIVSPAAKSLQLPLIGPSFVPDFGTSNSGCSDWMSHLPPLFSPWPETASCTPPPTQLDNFSGSVDYANTHAYHSTYYGGPAEFLKGWNVLHWWDNQYPGLPKIFTEVGYQDSLFEPVVQEKYTMRLLFELFNSGVKRTYIYEFLDEITPTSGKEVMGLIGFNADGSIKEKPAYTALKNTLTLLSDTNQTALKGLPIQVIAATTVHKTLLQDSKNNYYLVLWNELSKPSSATDILSNATVTLADKKNIEMFRPSTAATPQKTFTDSQEVTVAVPDDIVILKLSPTASTNGSAAVNSAKNSNEQSTASSQTAHTPDKQSSGASTSAITKSTGDTPKSSSSSVLSALMKSDPDPFSALAIAGIGLILFVLGSAIAYEIRFLLRARKKIAQGKN